MKLKRSKKSPQSTQAHYLEQQINEILSLIISKVRCQSRRDVTNLCLVSRQFYILAVPHLYRKITLDLDRASHLRLLQRLERPASHVPRMIRHLRVCLQGKHAEHIPRIEKVFAGLVNLEEFEWEGPLNMPFQLLEALHTRFRRARMSIKWKGAAYKGSGTDTSPLLGMDLWIRHPAASMITHLCLRMDEDSHIWPGFKRELVCMILRTPVLESLQIVASELFDNHCESMVEHMEGHVLPKLKDLRLFVGNSTLFTQDELLLWGHQSGWEDLKFLGLFHSQSLIPLVGRTPKLEELWLLPIDGADTTNLESCLAECKDPCPFPALRRLRTRSPWRDIAPATQNDRVIPWYLINRLPLEQLTCLDISRSTQRDQDVTDVPQAEDIASILSRCPNLGDLRFDMIIPWGDDPFPLDIMRELTAFPKPINLTVSLHVGPHPHLGSESLSLYVTRGVRWCCRSSFKIARCFRKERERQRIPGNPNFTVNIVWSSDVLAENHEARQVQYLICTVEVNQKVSRTCNTVLFRQTSDEDVERMSMEKLKEKTKPRLGNILAGRSRYFREIERRNDFDNIEAGGYGKDVTLYDVLTASDSE